MDLAGAPPVRLQRRSPSTLARNDSLPNFSSRNINARALYPAFDIEVEMARSLISSDPDARPAHFRNLFEECLFVFMVMMATASTTFLQGVVVINTATIARDLKMTPAQVTWISAAIGLGSGSFMLLFGRTADLFGSKLQFLTGMAFLSLTSLATAFVPSPIGLNVLCGFLGVGTAVVSPPAIGTLFATYPEGRRRNKAAGALGTGNPIGFILGSFSSALATKYYSWRASFVVIAIFFALMTVSSFWTMPSTPRTGSLRVEMRQFDYLGTVLTVAGFALVSAALTEGPELGWQSRQVVLMFLFGFICLLGFTTWESYYPFPLLNPVVWKNTTYTLCVLCVFFGYMSFITNLFWISLYMQNVQQLSSLIIALRLLPQALVGFIWSYIGQALVSKIPGKIIMGIGGVAYLVGAALQIFVRQDTSYWLLLFPSLCITVIGADFQFIVSNLYISKQMPSQASLAAGVLQTAMRLSISIGLAISAAVYGIAGNSSKGKSDVNVPFEHAYLCSIMFAVIAFLFIPFMEIEKQGTKLPTPSITKETAMIEEEGPQTGGEYPDLPISESYRGVISNKPSLASLWSAATAGSNDSFFPRWSWEPEMVWPDDRYQHRSSNVLYEVCIKCLEERVVVVQPNPIEARQRPLTLDPNPFRRTEENQYLEQTANWNTNNRHRTYIELQEGMSHCSSTETLANAYANSQQSSSRPPSRGQSREGSSSDGTTIVINGIATGNFTSSETLQPQAHDPVDNRVPSRRGTSPFNSISHFTSFSVPPQRSNTMPMIREDVRMSDAKMDGSDMTVIGLRDPMYKVSRGGRGWM